MQKALIASTERADYSLLQAIASTSAEASSNGNNACAADLSSEATPLDAKDAELSIQLQPVPIATYTSTLPSEANPIVATSTMAAVTLSTVPTLVHAALGRHCYRFCNRCSLQQSRDRKRANSKGKTAAHAGSIDDATSISSTEAIAAPVVACDEQLLDNVGPDLFADIFDSSPLPADSIFSTADFLNVDDTVAALPTAIPVAIAPNRPPTIATARRRRKTELEKLANIW